MTPRAGAKLRVIIWSAWTAVCGAVLTLAGAYLYLNPQLPSAETYRDVRLETPLLIYTTDGQLMGEFGERRLMPIRHAEVPPLFIRAVLDTEDKRFYEHSGVDVITLVNSVVELVANWGEITRGGSTITMQLPRNLGTFSRDKVFIRKFKEILLALKIERELTKDEILELYINVVPFGKRAYGAEAAAHTYYGRSLAELDLAELAMLAGIPQAPTRGNPINSPERALKRRNLVLSRMVEQGSITAEQYALASAAPNTAKVYDAELEVYAPFASEWVRQQMIERFGREAYTAGYAVATTVDSRLQQAASAAMHEGLLRYDRRHGYRGPEARVSLPETPSDPRALAAMLAPFTPRVGLVPALVTSVDAKAFSAVTKDGEAVTVTWDLMRWARRFVNVNERGPVPTTTGEIVSPGDVVRLRRTAEGWALSQLPEIQGALVALDPQNGAVRALIGGFDFSSNQYNHALQALRQPGSGFKPFVYSAALAQGVTPASIFLDAPLVFDDANLEATYRPRNVGGKYNGPTRLREALYRSINLVSMRVLLRVGADRVLEHAARFGFDTRTFPRDTQLAVGGGTIGITPLAMARGYAVFANGGYAVEPHVIGSVATRTGELVLEPQYPEVCETCETEPAPLVADLGNVGVSAELATDGDAAPTAPPAERVLDAGNAFIVHTMLQDVVQRGTGIRARSLGRNDLAGKTGTTNEADTWFTGYHPSLVASVWVGFSDHRPVGDNEFGSNTPLPIWIDFMRVALDGVPEANRTQPPDVLSMKIDPRTGQPARPDDADAIFEYFLADHAPLEEPSSRTHRPTEQDPVRPEEIF